MVKTVICPAKINLFLEIHEKRKSDGYHTLDSVMQTVDLADVITLNIEKGNGGISVLMGEKNADIPTDERNIAVKAAKKYFEAFDIIDYEATILIDKKIPTQAGLGGGSADAAGVLRALDEYFGFNDKKRLDDVALSVGADVPFCVNMGICRAEGVGEILTPCAKIPKNTSIVIAKGSGSVSTAQAYADFDALGNYVRRDSDDIIKAFEKNDLSFAGIMFNRFEEVIFPKLPEICEIKKTLYSCGAAGALMSGSGSAVFGIFEDDASASAALDTLLKKNVFACKTRPFYTE